MSLTLTTGTPSAEYSSWRHAPPFTKSANSPSFNFAHISESTPKPDSYLLIHAPQGLRPQCSRLSISRRVPRSSQQSHPHQEMRTGHSHNARDLGSKPLLRPQSGMQLGIAPERLDRHESGKSGLA